MSTIKRILTLAATSPMVAAWPSPDILGNGGQPMTLAPVPPTPKGGGMAPKHNGTGAAAARRRAKKNRNIRKRRSK